MKPWLLFCLLAMFASCTTTQPVTYGGLTPNQGTVDDEPATITQSLFNDKAATISEESIQKILDGSLKLPQQLRVTFARIEPSATARRYYWSYRSDETYLKTQQAYLDSLTQKFRQSSRVTKVSVLPDLLVSKTPTFTNIREAAVRMQSDILVIYSITSDIYTKYKLFNRPDIKAFATTQLIILDVRTGLIPFSTIVTKDFLAQREKSETGNEEARSRIQHQAVLLTLSEIGDQITTFLSRR